MMKATPGTVYLVGAGPGDPDLLTVRAQRLLYSADVVFHDDLVPASILQLSRPGARVVSVGKRCGAKATTQGQINDSLIKTAKSGQAVIRLKSGDPLLYGRASEEMAALGRAGIPFEVVPGVSAVFAAAADMHAPLTDRFSASSLIILTWHRIAGAGMAPLWEGKFPADATIAVYMPGSDYQRLGKALLDSGLAADTPCLVVSRAGTSQRQSLRTTAAALLHQKALPAPAILLAGWALERGQGILPRVSSIGRNHPSPDPSGRID
jgi:uroporphyrin-III C-methyltransferase